MDKAHGSPQSGWFCSQVAAVQMMQFHMSYAGKSCYWEQQKKCITVINCGSSQLPPVVHCVTHPHHHRQIQSRVCKARNQAESHNSTPCHNPKLIHSSLLLARNISSFSSQLPFSSGYLKTVKMFY